MENNPRYLMSALLGLVIFSLLVFPSVHAIAWVGNDDGEFDRCNNCHQTYVGLQESFGANMIWNPYTNGNGNQENLVSMQYNPDGYVSYWNQANSDWFQTLIYMGPAGCPDFSIEVWNTWWASWGVSRLDYRADYANIPCQIAYLSPGAVWYIREDLVSTSSSHISDVYFSIQGPNGVVYNHLFTDPGLQFWWWELSNLCWCGMDGGSVTFNGGYGTSTSYSDVNLVAVDPPNCLIGNNNCIATAENSNMPYSSFQNSPSPALYQTFGWAPPVGGGGGGGGSVASGTLITMVDGSQRAVQTLKAGDGIIMYDVYSGTSIHATITKVLSFTRDNRVTIYTQGNPPLRVDTRPDFYVWTTDGPVLKPVNALQSGDLLYSYYQNSWIPVTRVTVNYGGNHMYYDLITSPQFNSNGQVLSFIANGIADPCIPSCPL